MKMICFMNELGTNESQILKNCIHGIIENY